MAETLSYQEPQNVTTVDNLTPEEQDSLAVGESISQQEEQLYAGKYKNAQELEKAYVELQAKLGEKTEEKTETASADEQPRIHLRCPRVLRSSLMLARSTMITVTSYHLRLWLSSLLCQAKIYSRLTWRYHKTLSFKHSKVSHLTYLNQTLIRLRTQQAAIKHMLT